jgi:prophage DNA circulation protein
VRDVETALDTVRTMIQAAVDGSRGTAQSLKDAAEVLTDYVVEIKKLTPSLVAVEVDNETPLHLVCVQHGLSYQEAETLLLLNDIRSPSFVRGTVNLYG